MKLTADRRNELYDAWLMEQIVQHGVDNPLPHKEMVGTRYDSVGFNWIGHAANLFHVRFDKVDGVATVAFTPSALRYLERG